MAKTASSMLPLGTKAPKFTLPDTISNKNVSLNQAANTKGTVVMFICNHCPYVKHIIDELVTLAREYLTKDIQFFAINSNDIRSYPDDAPDNMKITAIENAYPFPYLFDETQEVANAYQAACTPDFFIFNNELTLIYRGQFDDSRPGNGIPVSGKSIRQTLDCLINNQAIPANQKPSLGCNIKWKGQR